MMSLSLRFDSVQQKIARIVSEKFEEILEIPLNAETLRVKDLDEIVLKGIAILDQKGDTALATKEVTAHISPFDLLRNRIQINTLAVAAPDIRINRATKDSALNIQFIIDKLKQKDDFEKKMFSVHINQLIIYDGRFRYDINDRPEDKTQFDPAHIDVNGIRCNISLKKFLKDELDLFVRSIRGEEKSGFELKRLKTNIKAIKGNVKLERVELELPHSSIESDSITVSYNQQNAKDFKIAANIDGKKLSPSDFAAFAPEFIEKIPELKFNIECHSDSILSHASLYVESFNNCISLKSSATIKNPYDISRNANITLSKLELNKEGLSLLQSFIKKSNFDFADKAGYLNMTADAEITNGKATGHISANTGSGNIVAESKYDNGKFSVTVNGHDINISNWTELDKPLKCSLLRTHASGYINESRKEIDIKGYAIDLNNGKYTFSPMEFAGTLDIKNRHYSTSISTVDPGITARMSIDYTNRHGHKAILSLDVDSITPGLIGLNGKKDGTFSFCFNSEFNQEHNGNRLINAKVQNLHFHDSNKESNVRNLHFCDTKTGGQRLVILNSDFANISIAGEFGYKSIISSIYKHITKHTPSMDIKYDTVSGINNNYIFKCDLKDTHFLSHVLNLPLTINGPSSINGACNDQIGALTINTSLNDIEFKKSRYRTFGLDGESTNKRLTLKTYVIKPSKSNENKKSTDDLRIELDCALFNDTILNNLSWTDNNKKKNGNLHMEAMVGRDSCDMVFMNAYIQPDSIIHNDSIWYLSGGYVSGNKNRINIDGLYLYNDSQYLRLNGNIGKSHEDTLSIKANNLEVSSIMDLVKFRILKFNGNATGSAHASALLSAPEVNGNFNVDSFKIDNGYLGKADLNIGWRNKDKSIFLNADIHNDNDSITKVSGFLSQANDTIHLDIDANEINAVFINKFVRSFMSDIDGTGSGKVQLLGKWRSIDMKGAVALNCSARINPTNVKYTLHGDSLYFTSGRLTFNNALATDKYGNKGWLSGNVTHKNLGMWACDLNAKTENLLVYDTHNFDENPFYGTVYATGNANLKANEKGLFLKAEASNNPNSRIIYNASESGSVRDNSFVTFIDSNKKPDLEKNNEENNHKYKNIESSLNLDFLIDVNEGLQTKVYTNLKSDDYIDLYGKGTINAIYDEKDGFSMKGNLDLDRGTYKITVQDIFTKEFSITKGSSLQFNGNPYDAKLDIHAKYLVPSASLSALTTETTNRKSVKVNCLLDITGTLESPTLDFDLELPDGNEEEKEMLASATSTPEQKNMQFIYLLSIGKFYTYDYNNPLATNTQSTTAVESLISNTLSGQLNNMLGQIINNGNWNISGNISTSERGWNSMEVEGMLEGRLLNDRLLINGNLGYRENPVANSNFIGDFELQWLLNKKGTISLKAYSKTNDRYFSKTNLTTQGAGILLRHDFNKWIWWKGKKKEKKRERTKKNDD